MFLEILFPPWLDVCVPNVGWVSDNSIEFPACGTGAELFLPCECVLGVGAHVVDEAVAAADVSGQVGQGLAGASGTDPEGELGELHGLGRDVHAEEVILEDEGRRMLDPVVAAASAFGIAGLDLAEVVEKAETMV